MTILRRRRVLSHVDADLRHPMLWVPISLRGPVSLRILRQLAGSSTMPVNGVGTAERTANGVRVVLYRPNAATGPMPALLWAHGGGMVAGTVEADHDRASSFALRAGALVVSVDYRLAPEHPFPSGLDDCAAALHWHHDQADDLGVDRTRIAVGGASAGGLLAAALAQRARDEGGPAVCFQLLVYPMLDDRTGLRPPSGNGVHNWTPTSNRWAWGAYLGHPAGQEDQRPWAIPGRRDDLMGLPPAWIGVGDLDLFHNEDRAYAERLRTAGVCCDLQVIPGMYHAADLWRPGAAASGDFQAQMAAALAAALTDHPPPRRS